MEETETQLYFFTFFPIGSDLFVLSQVFPTSCNRLLQISISLAVNRQRLSRYRKYIDKWVILFLQDDKNMTDYDH